MRDDREKLQDILEAIERIERYAMQGRQAFEQNELIQTWFTQNLQVIGEAARALSATTRDQHPEVHWARMIGIKSD
jgi:uncharacterized protein with HEPN domain